MSGAMTPKKRPKVTCLNGRFCRFRADKSFEQEKPSIEAITTLAAIAATTEDDDLLDAALSELDALALDRRDAMDPAGKVELLLAHNALITVSLIVDPLTSGRYHQGSVHPASLDARQTGLGRTSCSAGQNTVVP